LQHLPPMAKKTPAEALRPSDQDATGRLIDVLQSLVPQVEALTQQVGLLTERAQVLTEAIDDVRSEMEWAIRNLHYPPPRLISSPPPDDARDGLVKHVSARDPPAQESRYRASVEQRGLWQRPS